MILDNHLYLSDLPRETQLQILDDDAYLSVIDHPNYNPRLVEYVAKLAAHEGTQQTLPDFFLSTLDQPEGLWRHAVESQLDDDSHPIYSITHEDNATEVVATVGEEGVIAIVAGQPFYIFEAAENPRSVRGVR
jgi:hypothetical protein